MRVHIIYKSIFQHFRRPQGSTFAFQASFLE